MYIMIFQLKFPSFDSFICIVYIMVYIIIFNGFLHLIAWFEYLSPTVSWSDIFPVYIKRLSQKNQIFRICPQNSKPVLKLPSQGYL